MTHIQRTPIALSAFLLFTSSMLVGQVSPTPCADVGSRIRSDAAALRPSGVLLAITSPRAGETVTETSPSESITLTVDYWGPRLVAGESSDRVDDYHLVFFLDTNDSAYVGTMSPAPRCNPLIVHAASTSVTFDHVMHGWHTVYVMLVGSNDISVNPPVAASASFVATGSS